MLLAKTPADAARPRWSETLEGHLAQVGETAAVLVDLRGASALHALGSEEVRLEDLRWTVLAAAYLHDLGKCSDQFQRMVRREASLPQALRHEWLSAALLLEEPLHGWVFGAEPNPAREASVLAAVLGHHLKAQDREVFQPRPGSGNAEILLALDRPEMMRGLKRAGKELGLPPLPGLEAQRLRLCDWPSESFRTGLHRIARRLRSEVLARLAALAKAFLVAADGAGSALPKAQKEPARWARISLSEVLSRRETEAVVASRLNGHLPRPFQQQVAETGHRITFVRAGCGSGKTVAAYMWAARQARNRKLFVCYPTTGTATEGFRDYVFEVNAGPASSLLHSRSALDLADLLQAEDGVLELARRLRALQAWPSKVNVATVDRVLGLMQNSRSSLDLFPVLVDSAFVFDEIHQYDARLWSALVRFLETFRGLPVLLMTASLSRDRLHRLQAVATGLGEELAVVSGPEELETIERYALAPLATGIPWDQVASTVADGGKVLMVANTVNRCREVAGQARARGFAPVLVYHSRYRYRDRVARHRSVIDAFSTPGTALAVTTQVCEVSLDLSADLLVSDLAPFPALIQRLGRLNRKDPAGRGPLPAVVTEVAHGAPYCHEELTRSRELVRGLAGRKVSQRDLAEALEGSEQTDGEIDVRSEWLDGGVFTARAPLREGGYTWPILLHEDAPRCRDRRGRVDTDAVAAHEIPMPFSGKIADEAAAWPRLSYAFVAPPGRLEYSEELGGVWTR